MPHFQLPDKTPVDVILLDTAADEKGNPKRLTLEQAGFDYDGNPHMIWPAPGDESKIVVTTLGGPDMPTNATRFQLHAIAAGKSEVTARFYADQEKTRPPGAAGPTHPKGAENCKRLAAVSGLVTNHKDMKVDLFADLLGRSADARKVWVYWQSLKSTNNLLFSLDGTSPAWPEWDAKLANQPLKQVTDPKTPNRWNCGSALQSFGSANFGRIETGQVNLYRPPPSNKVADLRFDPGKLTAGLERIRKLLDGKTAVRVFVAHNDGFKTNGGVIQPDGNTHYVSIIGYNAAGTQYLILDPWPGGSNLTYTSGILGDVPSSFMGVMQYEPAGPSGPRLVTVPTGVPTSGLPPGVSVSRTGGHVYVLLTAPP